MIVFTNCQGCEAKTTSGNDSKWSNQSKQLFWWTGLKIPFWSHPITRVCQEQVLFKRKSQIFNFTSGCIWLVSRVCFSCKAGVWSGWNLQTANIIKLSTLNKKDLQFNQHYFRYISEKGVGTMLIIQMCWINMLLHAEFFSHRKLSWIYNISWKFHAFIFVYQISNNFV